MSNCPPAFSVCSSTLALIRSSRTHPGTVQCCAKPCLCDSLLADTLLTPYWCMVHGHQHHNPVQCSVTPSRSSSSPVGFDTTIKQWLQRLPSIKYNLRALANPGKVDFTTIDQKCRQKLFLSKWHNHNHEQPFSAKKGPKRVKSESFDKKKKRK